MSLPFPDIKPSARSFRMGSYPTKVYRAISGATVKRSFGNRPTGYSLSLQFENITDTQAQLIVKHYIDTAAGFVRFTLPAALFAGMGASLQGYIQAPTGIRWEYEQAPEVESVITGRSSVSVSLVGELTV